ncbi:MAG: sensor histidine kinase, partial [Chitinophagaceae bacterium]
ISAQEQERFEIGQELHDNVNQILTSAKLYAAQSRDEKKDTGQMIEKTISLLQNAIDEIRKLSKRLSASIITDMPLEDAMRELVDTVAAASKLKINLQSLPLKSSLNSPELKLAVYRILQEQLTNITKHAGASNIDITLRQSEERLTLIIVDDGRGFDATQKTEGVGLTNMQSRAESLMGTLTFSSQPGKGTTVIVQLPFKQM